MTLYIDINEPYDQATKLMSSSVECEVDSINSQGWADYRWTSIQGQDVHVERKTWPEILSNVDKVEDQLRRHFVDKPNARLIFILEGIVVPDSVGTSILKPTNRDTIFVKGYGSSVRLSRIYSWLYRVADYLECYMTPTYEATCIALVQMYKSDQKTEHETFNRYFKPIAFSPNPQIVQLMGLMPGVGEKRASALIDRFTTVWNVVNATPAELAEVDGIGKKLSVQLLQRIGRTDV